VLAGIESHRFPTGDLPTLLRTGAVERAVPVLRLSVRERRCHSARRHANEIRAATRIWRPRS